jgi:hypothetical protein
MHLYGSKRYDCLTCLYGCCGAKAHYRRRGTSSGRRVKAALRSRARRESRKLCAQGENEC